MNIAVRPHLKSPFATLWCAGLAMCLATGTAMAQVSVSEPEPTLPEVAAIEAASDRDAAVRVSASFEKLAGSEDNAVSLVEGLRSGSEITLTTKIDGQTVQRTFQPATGEQGYGSVFVSLVLAEQELARAGVLEPTPAQIEAALNGGVIAVRESDAIRTIGFSGVLNLRAEGHGWGRIARELDVNLGRAVSGVRRDAGAVTRFALRPEFAGKSVRPERPQTVGRVERAVRIERMERPMALERFDRPVRVERVEHPVRPERVDRPGRP